MIQDLMDQSCNIYQRVDSNLPGGVFRSKWVRIYSGTKCKIDFSNSGNEVESGAMRQTLTGRIFLPPTVSIDDNCAFEFRLPYPRREDRSIFARCTSHGGRYSPASSSPVLIMCSWEVIEGIEDGQ